ncbi:unnamed protein product, partial [Effrenium voratum]
ENLREAIVAAVEKGPATLAQVKRIPTVIKFTKILLPQAVALEDWIERRIGAEVAVDSDERGQRICRSMHGPVATKEAPPDFFSSLPKDSFLPEEERLRLAIFDFLAGWSSPDLATLNICAQHPPVAEAETASPRGARGPETSQRIWSFEVAAMGFQLWCSFETHSK